MSQRPRQNPSPNKRALLIGITDYPNLPPKARLHGSINDVNLMHDLLLRRFGFPERDIRKLCNEQATKIGILDAFKDLVASVEQNDVVVVHFSGHGSRIGDEKKASGQTETIVPYDSGRKSTNHPSTDITDENINDCLLRPLVSKTPFVTLLIDSCHSASILRDDFGGAIRGIDPDGEVRENRGVNNAQLSGWLPTVNYRSGDSSFLGYALLASCRADEYAWELQEDKYYGAFTYQFCKLIDGSPSRNEDMRTLFRLASAAVTAQYPHQHPILEAAEEARIFGTYSLETPRYLYIKKIETTGATRWVEMDGGLASGVTRGSIWAVRRLGDPPQDSDAWIKVIRPSALVSRAEVIRQGYIEGTFICFEILHDYGDAVLNILVDSQGGPRISELLSQSGNDNVSGTLNVVENAANPDVKVILLKPRRVVTTGDMVPQLGPLDRETWVALGRDGYNIIPPTHNFPTFCENLRGLARYQFGLTLRNMDENTTLRGKLGLELRWRPKDSGRDDPWQKPPLGMDDFPHFGNGDHIACVVTNHSNVPVWPYVLEYAEDGSVSQRYPYDGGEELLASGRSTKEVARMSLQASDNNAFQLPDIKDGTWTAQGNGGASRKRVTEVMKLFAATERIDLSLLLQTSFARGQGLSRGLSSLLRLGVMLNDRGRGVTDDAWWTVELPFVLEIDPGDAESG